MATGEDWSHYEVEACVAEYLHMLTLQLNGQRVIKSERVQSLMLRVDGRSKASVEYKFRNASAVMQELGWPTVNGYKALENYQAILFETIEKQLQTNPSLETAVENAVQRPAVAIDAPELDQAWVYKPKNLQKKPQGSILRFSPARRDYLAQEARNRSLGNAGEVFILELEKQRLRAAGKMSLANRIEHVAASQGDGLGYDILSFETDGCERLIEVKTTAFGELTPFFVTRNELARSRADSERYQLYRVFNFRERARVFVLQGCISDHCDLSATSFLACIS